MPAAHKPTKETREKVMAMAVAGCSQTLIAKVIGVAKNSLRKHYRSELDTGLGEVQALAGAKLVELVKQGSFKAIAMVLKRNPEWQDKLNLHHTGEQEVIHTYQLPTNER